MLWQHALKVVGTYAQAQQTGSETATCSAENAGISFDPESKCLCSAACLSIRRQVSRKVTERVLPDLELAVQEPFSLS